MTAKTILYVEDNELNRKIVRDLLRRTSYRLIEALDGEAGMTVAREQRPDLILMDLQLPKVSGIEATRALRAEPSTAATPIIAHHVVRPERRRATGKGGRRVHLPGEALQPVRPAHHDSEAG